MPFTQQQSVFVLSMMSNLAITQKGSASQIEAYLAGQIDGFLAQLESDIGAWTRVWGPAVFQLPGSNVADNAMYVARSASGSQYVVAVAGTNMFSVFDWLVEDFFVARQLPWTYGEPPAGAAISVGAFTGLTALQFLRPSPGFPGAALTVTDFLKTVVTQAVDVTVSGHSLGGALSPAVALWLLDTQPKWDPDLHATVACEPTAGPTTGNGLFAGYYDQRLGGRTTRLYNSLDIVPHVWNEADIATLPALYAPAIQPDLVIDALVAVVKAAGWAGDYTQVEAGTPALAGTVNSGLISPQFPAFENYLAQAAYQHINEYFVLLNLLPACNDLLEALLGGLGSNGLSSIAASLRAKMARRLAIPTGL